MDPSFHGRPRSGDLEANDLEDTSLMNNTVHSLAWNGLIVTVKDWETKKMRDLLCDASGYAKQGLCILTDMVDFG